MANYDDVFNARGDLYNRATAMCPDARAEERRLLVERLAPAPGDRIADAPAGGGYLADELARLGADVLCVEPSPRFAEAIAGRHRTVICPLDRIDTPAASVDKVGSLAGLHHLADPADFFAQAFGILRPGGLIAVADVRLDTPPAAFLNGPVDRLTDTGHDGRFFADGDLTRQLASVGFTPLEERHELFTWRFPDRPTLDAYVHDLFGLVRATRTQVADALDAHFPITASPTGGTGAALPWSLLYATARKPADA